MKKNPSPYVTRKEIEEKFESSFKSLEVRIGIIFDNLERRIIDQVLNIRDQILTSNDKVAKELDNIRTNYQIAIDNYEEIRDKVDNHEKRITKLENN